MLAGLAQLGLVGLLIAQPAADPRLGDDFPVPRMTELPGDVEPFEYVDAEIAFYPPGERSRGEARLNQMQLPLSPEESMKHLSVPVGFEARLFAAEPDVAKPICIAWDERGRLWIAESVDYPNEPKAPGPGRDRIKICEDTTGDGRADRFTVFADGLSIPTSLTFSNGGVIVAQAPQTLFLKDTDGDDVADVREVLFEGWGTDDTHAGPSNLRYGLDNRIWGMIGYAGFDGTVGEERHRFRQGFYRFRPDGSELEFLRSTSNNTWGLGFSEEGLVLGSTANRVPSVYLPIPNRYYERVRGWSASVLELIADTHLFRAITDKVRQVDHHGGYTAAAGHALYTARTYPPEYWNRVAFVNEPTGHLTGAFVLDRDGADVRSANLFNLLASDDEWTAPIVAEVGPDGHVWIVDWYNFIVQHNPTPAGFETGVGNAYETPLRDKAHGRIYRVVYSEADAAEPMSLAGAPPDRLVETLSHPNMFWRLHAQRLLVERGDRDVAPALIRLVGDESVDAIGLNPGAIHALWTLHGLGALDGSDRRASAAAVAALRHPSAGVRRNAAQVVPRDEAADAILEAGLLADPDAQVRLAALLALSEAPEADAVGSAVAEALARPENAGDRWLPDAATSAGSAHAAGFLGRLAEAGGEPPRSAVEAARVVAEHVARGRPDDAIDRLLVDLAEAPPAIRDAVIAGLAAGWPERHRIALSGPADRALAGLLEGAGPGTIARLVRLGSAWGSDRVDAYAAEVVAELLRVVDDERAGDDARAAAARELVEYRPESIEAAERVLDRIGPRMAPGLAAALIDAVGRGRAEGLGAALVDRLAGLTPAARDAAFRALLARPEPTRDLLDAADAGRVALADLALDQQQALLNHPDAAIADRATALLGRGDGLPDPDRERVLRELMPLADRDGDHARGLEVYREHCSKCHRHGAEGTPIGPDLSGMAVHPKQELLTHIIDPSRNVEGTYRTYTVATLDGRVLSGMLASETRTTIELVDTNAETIVLQRDEIEELAASEKSLMPEGFERQMTPDDLADLLAFLAHRDRYLPLDLREAASVVTTLGMFHSPDSLSERLVFPDWGPKEVDGVPFLLIDPRGDRVPNAVMLHSPNGTIPPRMPKAVALPCNAPAAAIHLLGGVSGWGAKGPREPGTVSLIVRLHYRDGATEDHELRDGRHLADYVGPFEVPESTLAFELRGRQVRCLAVEPARGEVIERIELLDGPDDTAPIVLAITVELPEESDG